MHTTGAFTLQLIVKFKAQNNMRKCESTDVTSWQTYKGTNMEESTSVCMLTKHSKVSHDWKASAGICPRLYEAKEITTKQSANVEESNLHSSFSW